MVNADNFLLKEWLEPKKFRNLFISPQRYLPSDFQFFFSPLREFRFILLLVFSNIIVLYSEIKHVLTTIFSELVWRKRRLGRLFFGFGHYNDIAIMGVIKFDLCIIWKLTDNLCSIGVSQFISMLLSALAYETAHKAHYTLDGGALDLAFRVSREQRVSHFEIKNSVCN